MNEVRMLKLFLGNEEPINNIATKSRMLFGVAVSLLKKR